MVRRPRSAFDEPLRVVSVDGEVVITGPEHMHGAFSADAARRSAAILEQMAERAGREETLEQDEED